MCNFSTHAIRKNSYLSSFRQEYTVSPYSNVQVNCPFNVRIRPLNVFEQGDQDKVIVNLLSNVKSPLPILHCTQTENCIKIFNSGTAKETGTLCVIDAPIKASMYDNVLACVLYINKY